MLEAAANDAKKNYHNMLSTIKQLTDELKSILNDQDFTTLLRITERTRETTFKKSSQRLKDKFEYLSGIRSPRKSPEEYERAVKTAVLNLTQREIPANHMKLLNLGPKFVPSINKVPVMEIITTTEIAALELERNSQTVEAERLRHDVSKLLGKHVNRKLPSNLDSENSAALEELKQDTELKVVPFDKGVGFALLEKEEMISKISAELGEAKVIEKDPTNTLVTKIQKVVSKLHKEDKIDKKTFYSMYPSDAQAPRLYGVVKAHKPQKNYPMRTVVSTVGTATHGASKFCVDLIQSTLDKNEVRIKNSTSFVNEASEWEISTEEVQVSYDVVALYPSVPIKKAIEAIIDLLKQDEEFESRTKLTIADIKKLLEVCLNTCYFVWNELIYQIKDAGPIGLSLMVVIAEGYLQVLEKRAIEDALSNDISLKTYRRYVDDSHARFETEECSLKFLDILNKQDQQIQYTIEKQSNDGELSFLDVTVTNNKHGGYDFKVHRKQAITNVQINKSSSVNPQLVFGVFKGFLARAMRICSPQHLEQEIKFLIQIFAENGHESSRLEKIAASYTTEDSEQPEDSDEVNKPVVCVPWIPKLGPRLRAVMKKRGIKTVFSSGRNLKDILCNHKTPLPRNSHPGVYRLRCGCGATYIGETKKKITTRVKEHEKYVFKGQWKQSAAADHASTCSEEFQWDTAETICTISNWKHRKVREALEIRRHQRSNMNIVNKDQGTLLKSDQWNPLLGTMANELRLTSDQ